MSFQCFKTASAQKPTETDPQAETNMGVRERLPQEAGVTGLSSSAAGDSSSKSLRYRINKSPLTGE